MTEVESANFYINTFITATNTSIKVDSLGTTIQYNNFRIKECLGDMFYKYNTFKLVLNGVIAFSGVSATNSLLSVKMSGLDWVNTYEYKITSDDSVAFLGTITAGINNQLSNFIGCDFNRPSNDVVNLTINLHDLSTNSKNPTLNYGLFVFYFTIYGVN